MISLFVWMWLSIPQWIRWVIIAIPITLGVVISIVEWDWPGLVVGGVTSLIFFVLPGQSETEKKGYHF